MVRNLLAITRIDAGALELRHDWVDLREIVARVVHAARRRGAAQTIAIDLPPDLPLVRADATLIEQALGNVIGNAIVHTPDATHIAVTADVGASEIALHVTDDGPGIPADTLPRVFDKFVHRRAGREPRRQAATAPGSASPSPRASWKRIGGHIGAQSPATPDAARA